MNRIAMMLLAAAVSLSLNSCYKNSIKGEGAVVTETRSIPAIKNIEADGDVDVEIYPATYNRVEVSGYQNLVPVYETSVSGNTLFLHFDDRYWNVRNNNIRVRVYLTGLEKISMNGSGNMSVNADMDSDAMEANINGSGNIYIGENHFDDLRINVNGSGEINSRSAIARNAWADVSGSGNIDLTVTSYLHARISGSGNIDYWGNPSEVNSEVSGSGKIRKH